MKKIILVLIGLLITGYGGYSLYTTFSAKEVVAFNINDYKDSVEEIQCGENNEYFGSAFILEVNEGEYELFTNKHISDNGKLDCWLPVYELELKDPIISEEVDLIRYRITKESIIDLLSIKDSGYSIDVPFCKDGMKVGTEIWTIGYPSYTARIILTGEERHDKISTNGIITGYSNPINPPSIIDRTNYSNLFIFKHKNYYVSNKLDTGNSGGLALANTNNTRDGVCILGIPTWSLTGYYANTGIILNAQNLNVR